MSELFDMTPDLPDGCWILREFCDKMQQMALVEFSRQLLTTHPLATPKTLRGHDLSLKVSSWGKVGWFGHNGQYKYISEHPVTKQPWPGIPILIHQVIDDALESVIKDLNATLYSFTDFRLDTVLLNYYPAPGGRLGRHQDVTEEDRESPIVTISLGDSAIFNIGSTSYEDKGVDIQVNSGDVIVMGLQSRMAYHGIKKILPGTSDLLKQGGRISLTGRKVFND
jgi:DNA oxidative demethylase